jgi:EmrB/QacA subfamily drug resistance transporter
VAPVEEGERARDLAFDAPGTEEATYLPWPLLLQRRVTARVERSDRYPWLVLATVLFGLFAVGFSITILSNARPRIAADLGTDTGTLTWLITGPVLGFAVFSPAAGKLADLLGQRRVYLTSLVGVAVFAALTAMSPSAGWLIAFRIIGAAVGAATGPASLAVINRLFLPQDRSKAMGYWAMVGAGGPVVGVVAGGPVVEAFGWRWIFIAQVPLTVATLLLAATVLPRDRRVEGDRPRFDIAGSATLGLGVTFLLLAMNRAPAWGWSHPVVVAGLLLAPALLVAFVAVERRATSPLVPLEYLHRPNFSFPILTQFCTNFAYMGGFAITPLLLQQEFGYTETHTGWLLIARPSVFAVAGPIAGYVTLRIGERTSAVVGGLAIAASMLALAAVAPGDSDWIVAGSLALSGLGMGTASPAMAAAIANSVHEDDLGIAGAAQQMMNQVGVVIGIQVMQSIQEGRADAIGAVPAYGESFLAGGVIAAVGVVLALFVRSTPRQLGVAPGHYDPELHPVRR